ncbi:MAG TPA: invasion associated locus B family protein, partial [Xanthobacteraceae bacterium]|nr:invasion associated locus B family protein [Xanthobacteraceae bacterium]
MTALVSAPAQPVRRVATCIATVAALTVGTSFALAQQPAQPVPAPKATPRPVQPAQKAPAKQPQQPAQQAPA